MEHEYYNLVKSVALKFKGELEDNIQNGFIGFIKAKKKYNGKTKLSTFSYKYIKGSIIDGNRSFYGRCDKYGKTMPVFTMFDYEPSYEDKDTDHFLRKRVSELPERQALFINKHFYDGMLQKEIAKEFNFSSELVCIEIRRGLNTLRDLL